MTITVIDEARSAHELRHRPLVRAAFAAGRLSYSAVRVLTRIEGPDAAVDASLIDLAEAGTLADVERATRIYQRYQDQDRPPSPISERRGLHITPRGDGRTVVEITLEATEAEEPPLGSSQPRSWLGSLATRQGPVVTPPRYGVPMRAVVPESLLAERRKLGHDRFDEMWEGELHMVPPPSFGHQQVASWLLVSWWSVARQAGMVVAMETGLFDPAVADSSSYRQPDVVVVRPEHTSHRGIEGKAELVVEVRSPGDETYQKLPFYERMGVHEILVVELDFSLRHWTRPGETLLEVLADQDGWVQLAGLPVRLRPDRARRLCMEGPFGVSALD